MVIVAVAPENGQDFLLTQPGCAFSKLEQPFGHGRSLAAQEFLASEWQAHEHVLILVEGNRRPKIRHLSKYESPGEPPSRFPSIQVAILAEAWRFVF